MPADRPAADAVQVINRDLSIAMLKYFIQRRQEEAASGKQRKQPPKRHQKGKANAAGPAPEEVGAFFGM